MYIHEKVTLEEDINFLGHMSRNGALGSYGRPSLFLKFISTSFPSGCSSCYSHKKMKKYTLSQYPCHHCFHNLSHSEWGKMKSSNWFNLHFMIARNFENLQIYFVTMCIFHSKVHCSVLRSFFCCIVCLHDI